jgi:hypothetical protein
MLVKLTPGDVVDDVDDVSRVEHVPVVGNLLQDLCCRVTIDDDTLKQIGSFSDLVAKKTLCFRRSTLAPTLIPTPTSNSTLKKTFLRDKFCLPVDTLVFGRLYRTISLQFSSFHRFLELRCKVTT